MFFAHFNGSKGRLQCSSRPWRSVGGPACARLLLCLAVSLVLAQPAAAAFLDDLVTLPPEFAGQVPARLVFSQAEFSTCLADTTADRCVLRAPIKLDEARWRQFFASTGGVSVQPVDSPPNTITSDACINNGECMVDPRNTSNTQLLDFSAIPSAILVRGVLVFANVHIFNLASPASYTYGGAQPYRSTGLGISTWPTIALAPNATFIVFNASVLYFNPSSDTCEQYTLKRLWTFRQVYGPNNISVVNATTILIVGPQNITVTIRNASTDDFVGNATLVYKNVAFTCLPRPTARPPGLSAGALAAAITVPVVVVILLASALLAWRLQQRKHRQRQLQQQPLARDAGQRGPKDLESGSQLLPRPSAGSADTSSLADQLPGKAAMPSSDASEQAPGAGSSSYGSSATSTPPAAACDAALACAAASSKLGIQLTARHTGSQQAGGAAAAEGHQQLTTPPGQGSAVQGTPAAPGTSASTGSSLALQSSRAPPRSSSSRSDLGSAAALLKARSDVAVLRDLKIGPLLGRGSYGRVYRGRWKATTVAVKIIEHSAPGAASSGGMGASAGREALLATTVSHPNLVTTYHISTMTMSQRRALASRWLAEAGDAGGSSSRLTPAGSSSSDGGGSGLRPPSLSGRAATSASTDPSLASSLASSSDDDEDDAGGARPDLCETWVLMEYCERGSLERVLKQGKLRDPVDSSQPDTVGIYKALLDTAAGLDYLHSIGVVHGDLKAANVLLKGSSRDARGFVCKITDFGLSRVLDRNATHISTGTYGTIVYMPKELLLSGRMTQATDIYSFGLMMWELLTGQPVMEEGLTIGQMFYMIAYQGWRPQLPASCPPGYVELMTACWAEDPEQRPSAQVLLRRLQRLYVQAKQQLAGSRVSGAEPEAAAFGSAAGDEVSVPQESLPADAPPAATAAAATASAGTSSAATQLPGASMLLQQQQQQQQQQQRRAELPFSQPALQQAAQQRTQLPQARMPGPAKQLSRRSCNVPAGSAAGGGADVGGEHAAHEGARSPRHSTGRPSTSSNAGDAEPLVPYAQAVLERASSRTLAAGPPKPGSPTGLRLAQHEAHPPAAAAAERDAAAGAAARAPRQAASARALGVRGAAAALRGVSPHQAQA